jgi:hypothetical protein
VSRGFLSSASPEPAAAVSPAAAAAPRAVQPQAPSGLLVWAALWTVYIVWGSTYLALRVLVETVPPLISNGGRFLLAGSLMLGVLALRRRSIRITRAEALSSLLIGSLMMGAVATVATAEQDVPSNLAALFVACVPLWVLLLRRLGGSTSRRGSCSPVSGFRLPGEPLVPRARLRRRYAPVSACCCSRAARPAARRSLRCCSSSARRPRGRPAPTCRGASRSRRIRWCRSGGR